MKWTISVFVLFACLWSELGNAVNGAPIEISPSTRLTELATEGVGALMRTGTFNDVEKGKEITREIEHSRGNASYIGESKNGSVLLVHANHVTKEGKAAPELLGDLKLMFGPAVTELRTGNLDRRYWYPNLSNATIYVYPEYQKSGGKSTDGIALIEMPNHFDVPRRPIPLIEAGASLPSNGPYYTVGMGHEADESVSLEATLTQYQAQRTSGKLRFAALKLQQIFPSGALKFIPLPYGEWKDIHESEFPNIDGIVDGPCDRDGGAPLVVETSRLKEVNGETVAVQSMVLTGMFYSVAGTCVRESSKNVPAIAYVNLAKPAIQEWMAKIVTRIARP